jgi:hypothetical protein
MPRPAQASGLSPAARVERPAEEPEGSREGEEGRAGAGDAHRNRAKRPVSDEVGAQGDQEHAQQQKKGPQSHDPALEQRERQTMLAPGGVLDRPQEPGGVSPPTLPGSTRLKNSPTSDSRAAAGQLRPIPCAARSNTSTA